MAGGCRGVLCILKSRRIRTTVLLEGTALSPEAKTLKTPGDLRASMSELLGRWSPGTIW